MENENLKFTELAEEIFNKYLEIYPQNGTGLGLHEYDGKIGDLSRESIERNHKVCKELHKKLSDIDASRLTKENRFDLEVAKWGLECDFFETEEMKGFEKNPMTYAFLFGDLGDYISREYAPFDDRLKSVINIIDKVPIALENAEKNLNKILPAVLCRYAIQFSQGYESFLKGELLETIKEKAEDKKLIDIYSEKSDKAIKAFEKYVEFLKSVSSDTDRSYVTGKEKFEKMLKVKEHINLSVDELKVIGFAELEKLKNELKIILKENDFEGKIETLEHSHPDENTLIDETNKTLNELIEFIRKNDIVNLPDKLNCIVTEMPKYMNFGFAAMGTAGPFEKSDESFYYVNLPEKEWDEKKKEEWMTQFNFPVLKLISIHEAYPGHYTHFLNANEYSSKLVKLFMSYSYVEGWAHYTEEMMIKEGYGKDDFKIKIGMLIEALIRCCRYIGSIMMHCEEKSIDEVKNMFLENAYMTETTATQEAERAAFDPGYLNYTLGKIQLKKFKKKYFDKFGDKKSLKDFHNMIVSLGVPTYDIAERFVLEN